ncbi:MAG: hypothetical protein Q9169_006178 [Polycauliona sp. 2 TL-2023]
MGETEMSSLLNRCDAFKCADEERQELIKTLIETNARLENELKVAISDHLDQLTSRRHWQEKAQSYESKLNETTTNGFLLCLIDGDGYLFENNLISRGAAGGGEAANRLLHSIKRSVQQHGSVKIIVRVYANIEGLLKKFAYIGFAEEEKAMRQFVAGFTQSQPLFDFIDAGQGKERADHKIKEQLSLFANNVQCKHIMLGVAHDNGYVPTLDPYKNSALASRITLLKPGHGQLGREFRGLPFEVLQFDSIFHATELTNERALSKLQYIPTWPANPPPQATVPHRERKSPTTTNHHTTNRPTSRNPIYPGPILLNQDDERVDEYLGTPSEFTEKLLKSRINNGQKLCNNHYLLQRCIAGSTCQYSHEPTLAREELVAFALKARLSRCNKLSKCRDRLCVSGHVCPQGVGCSRKICTFAKVHHVDPTVDREVAFANGGAVEPVVGVKRFSARG